MILGYAALSRKQIEQGIARLSDAIDDAIDDPSADVNALFVRASLPLPATFAACQDRTPSAHLDPSFLRQPALTARAAAADTCRPAQCAKRVTSMVAVSKICRYPIKGLSAQPLSSVMLEAGKPFPLDRVFALARPGAPIDRNDPKWAKKGLFVMLMLDEGLAQVTTSSRSRNHAAYRPAGRRQVASAQLDDEADRAKSRNSSGSCCRPSAPRRRWCARAAGISWTSRTTSFR